MAPSSEAPRKRLEMVKKLRPLAKNIVKYLQPTLSSEASRANIVQYLKGMLKEKKLDAFETGSFAWKAYLPDSDIDIGIIPRDAKDACKNTDVYAEQDTLMSVNELLCLESCRPNGDKNKDNKSRVTHKPIVRNVSFVSGHVKVVKCVVNNITVDLCILQRKALGAVSYFEAIDRLVGLDHLFKRSLILIKGWCTYEGIRFAKATMGSGTAMAKGNRNHNSASNSDTGNADVVIGASKGGLSSYGLTVLVASLFLHHMNPTSTASCRNGSNKAAQGGRPLCSIRDPLDALIVFLDFYHNFDWSKYCISTFGVVPLEHGNVMEPLTPQRKFQYKLATALRDRALDGTLVERCSGKNKYAAVEKIEVSAEFPVRACNIIDPFDNANNLGRSINLQSFQLLKNMFKNGHRCIIEILSASNKHSEFTIIDEILFRTIKKSFGRGDGWRPDLLSHPCQKWYSNGASKRVSDREKCLEPNICVKANGLDMDQNLVHRSVSGLKKMRTSDDSKKANVEKVDVVENASAEKHQNPKSIPAAKVLPKITCKPEATTFATGYPMHMRILFYFVFGYLALAQIRQELAGMLGQAQIDSLVSKKQTHLGNDKKNSYASMQGSLAQSLYHGVDLNSELIVMEQDLEIQRKYLINPERMMRMLNIEDDRFHSENRDDREGDIKFTTTSSDVETHSAQRYLSQSVRNAYALNRLQRIIAIEKERIDVVKTKGAMWIDKNNVDERKKELDHEQFKNTDNEFAGLPEVYSTYSNQWVSTGSQVIFKVNVKWPISNGHHRLYFQWRRNGVDIPGAIGHLMILNAVTINDEGTYTCAVSNEKSQTVIWEESVLHVASPPKVKLEFVKVVVRKGDSVSLSVNLLSGTPRPKFQWRINGVDIPGAISETYAVPSAGENDVGTYTCMVANLAGSVVWEENILLLEGVNPLMKKGSVSDWQERQASLDVHIEKGKVKIKI